MLAGFTVCIIAIAIHLYTAPLINDFCQCGKPNDPSYSMSYSMSVSKEATRVLKSKTNKRV